MTKKLHEDKPYISPNQLADRWQCSRASVDRITRRAGIPRLYLGEGKNGTVRYPKKEAMAYEQERLISTN